MLIGREAERQVIDQLVATARIGNSGVLAITGEPGVGKTALLDYGRSRLEGFRLIRATGTEPEREIPFAGLLALLRPALEQLDRIPGPQAEALSAALALREGSGGDRFAIGAATLSLICRYAEESPLAVVVDDLHLIDLPSAEALVFAARRLSADPIAVLLAARSGEADDQIAGLPELRIGGLELRAARDLVRSTTGTPMADENVVRLHEVTGGNPLAMLELGSDPGILEQTGPDVPPPVSAALVASYARRVRALDPVTRSVLLVAVAANGDLRLASAACEILDLDPSRLARAEQEGMLRVTGGQVAFRHPLLRAAVYADATADERRTAHRTIAGVLPEDDTDRRAWHLSESSWAPDAAVADLLTTTAEHAVARSAYAVASTAYERAARLSPDPEAEISRLTRAAETAWSAGLGQRAIALLDEVGGGPVSADELNAGLQLRAAIAARTGSLAEARDMLEHAATQTPFADTEITLLADAIHATFYLADTDATRRLGDRLSKVMDAATSTQARAVGMMAAGMAKVLTGRGGTAEIRSAMPLLAGSVELREDTRRLPWLMLAPLFLRDSDAEAAELRHLVDDVRTRAGVGTLPNLLFHVARDQATTSSWRRADANYSEAIRLARETGQSTELAVSLAGLAWLESRQGHEAACREHAAEALSICADRSIRLGEAWVLYALGDLELGLGNARGAVEHLEQLDKLLQTLGLVDPDLSPRPELTDALLRLGRVDEAERAALGYLAAANAKGQPWARARGERAAGLVASADSFDEPFRAALELHGQTLDGFEASRTRLAYGARLRRIGRRVDARPHLREALEVFSELGAGRWADLTAAELDATGEKVAPRESTGVEALTSQELQVSLLLADGRTTREAAAALFLSPKTVEYHLRKVYTKLGIHSREELAERLPRS